MPRGPDAGLGVGDAEDLDDRQRAVEYWNGSQLRAGPVFEHVVESSLVAWADPSTLRRGKPIVQGSTRK